MLDESSGVVGTKRVRIRVRRLTMYVAALGHEDLK